ncbi:MAG: hypothetical protein K2Q12_02120 [Rickettsiales bacterium]|nr:hypothetical protein [Rickettsiales bacterium]
MTFARWDIPSAAPQATAANATGGHVAALEAKKQARPPSNEPLTVADIQLLLKCTKKGALDEVHVTTPTEGLNIGEIDYGKHMMTDLVRADLHRSFKLEALRDGTSPKTRGELSASLDKAIERFFDVLKTIGWPRTQTSLENFENAILDCGHAPSLSVPKVPKVSAEDQGVIYLREYAVQLRDMVMNSLPQHVCEVPGYKVG